MGYGPEKGESELGFAGIYRATTDGRIQLLERELAWPNGLAFSPDGTRFYANDTKTVVIYAWDVKGTTITNKRVFAKLTVAGKDPFADGMRLDRRGFVYAANTDGVWVFDRAGVKLGVISVPEVVSNLEFGDKDQKTLYITADTGLYRIRVLNPGR